MATELETQIEDGVAVITVSGDLVVGPDVGILHQHVKTLVGDDVVEVVIDFSSVNWFGSAMLGVLAACYTTLQNVGGHMRLTGVSDKVKQILEVTRLGNVFDTFHSISEAKESLKMPGVVAK